MEIINKIEEHNINKVLKHMKEGNPIIIPTDTNYNLACFPKSKDAIDKIFKYKQRPKNKPLSLFFLNPSDWIKYGVCQNPKLMECLISAFWPGPLNIIVEKKNTEYDYMLNNIESIALGCISNPTWKKFMGYLNGSPIAITSANISGTIDDTLVTKDIAMSQLGECVKYFIESETDITTSKSSTIVSVCAHSIRILREGDISKEMLSNVLSKEGVEIE